MTIYDSQTEAAVFPEFDRLGCIRASGHYPQTFTDTDGTAFRAKPDFFHPASGLYIEFKAAPLNSKTTKATAERAKASQQARKGFLTGWDWLQCGWNHSKAKQAIVQRVLTPQEFIVVFHQPPTLAEARTYKDAGIVFVPLSALPAYLLYARLAAAGIKTSFLLRYDVEEIGAMVFALGPFDRSDLAALA